MLRSRANEIPELVRQLGSRSRARVDAARARLSIIGARAVEALIAALEGDDTRIRAHAMPLLALIRDARGREPLIAMLLDRHARLRGIAAGCLARFPHADSVAALGRLLDREKNEDVRTAAVLALVEQQAAGRDEAAGRLLGLLVDRGESTGPRRAALGLLRTLRPAQRRGILARLADDADDEIRRAAEEVGRGSTDPAAGADGLAHWVERLAAEDYAVWNEAVRRLGQGGPEAAATVIAAMSARAHDPEFCTRCGMVLKALGPRRARQVGDALDTLEDPLPLQVLVEVVGSLGEKSLIYRLKDLIERMATRTDDEAARNGVDPFRRVRAKAHLELARIGSRVAIGDLRDATVERDRRVELEMIAALELIGKREDLVVLLKAFEREDPFVRRRIADSIHTIMRRERIRRNDRVFRDLDENQRHALDSLLARARGRPTRTAQREIAPD